MPEVFTYLIQKDRDAIAPSVQDAYKLPELASRPVVRDELRKQFLVFGSRNEFVEWYEAVPEAERSHHEVIFGKLPQRLKFDVDAPAHKLDAISDAVLAAALESVRAPHGRFESAASELASAGMDAYIEELLGGAPTTPMQDAQPPTPMQDAQPMTRAAKIHAVVNILIEAVLDELYIAYYGIEDLVPSRNDVAVTDSSNESKYSYHVLVLPHYVADNEEAREFTGRVLERIPAPLRIFVDPDVNKRTQNFRLTGSAKPGTNRYKRASLETARAFGTVENLRVHDLFVTAPPGAKIMPRVYTQGAAKNAREPARASAGDAVVKAALEIAAREGALDGHEFREVRGTLLCFARAAPSYCRICCETHHRDNSLLVSVDPVEGGHDGAWPGNGAVACEVVEHCRQARGRGRLLGSVQLRADDLRAAGPFGPFGLNRRNVVRRAAGADSDAGASDSASAGAATGASAATGGAAHLSLTERLTRRIAAINGGQSNPHDALASAFEQLPESQKTVYSEPRMRSYELAPTLAVLAQMKLGKTKALREYVAHHFPADGLETKVVRFVTFRQTFSASIAKDFPDFVMYKDVSGDLDPVQHPRLIVQVESLHRLKMGARPEPVDLLVLDEVESILAQFNSGLHKHFGAAFAMFQWMMQTARHVVCMDANISDRTYRTLELLRPAHPLRFHWNRFARAADDVYHFTADQGAWLGALHAQLRANLRVVIPTNSLTEAKAYEEAIKREFPSKKVMLYSSETAPGEKARHFADVHSHWGALDVLIFTPTCSAGVSFELDHFDTLFGFFCDASCDVETCRQMLGRVRNLRSHEHYICLRAAGDTLPVTTHEIRRLIHDKRAGMYRGVEDTALQFEYDAEGEIRFYESNYFHLWLENVRVGNLSRNDFARRFVDQVADTGARCRVLSIDAAQAAAGAALLLVHRETRVDLKTARCEAVAAAEDISPEEANSVREQMRGQQDVEPAKRLALEKFQLRDYYAWHGRPLDAEFVANYQNQDARRVYRNLLSVTDAETMRDAVNAMRAQETNHYDYVMDTRAAGPASFVNESRDLLRDRTTYVSRAHHTAVWLLHVCGFVCITDRKRVHEALLEQRLRSAVPAMLKAMDRIVFELEIPRPGVERLSRDADRSRFLTGMLRFVNAVLRKMYGVQLQRALKRAGGNFYFIGHNAVGKLFVFAPHPERDDAPGGARPHVPSRLVQLRDGAQDSVVNFMEDVFYDDDLFAGLVCEENASAGDGDSDGYAAPDDVVLDELPRAPDHDADSRQSARAPADANARTPADANAGDHAGDHAGDDAGDVEEDLFAYLY